MVLVMASMTVHAKGSCTAEKIGQLQKQMDTANQEAEKLSAIANYLADRAEAGDLSSSQSDLVFGLSAEVRDKSIQILNANVSVSEELVDCITTGQ